MNDTTYQLMARQFVEMWQQQLSRMLADEKFAHAMLDMIQQKPFMPFNAAPAQEPKSHDRNHAEADQPAVSSDAGGDALRVYERRLAACEARIAALESELAAFRPKR